MAQAPTPTPFGMQDPQLKALEGRILEEKMRLNAATEHLKTLEVASRPFFSEQINKREQTTNALLNFFCRCLFFGGRERFFCVLGDRCELQV